MSAPFCVIQTNLIRVARTGHSLSSASSSISSSNPIRRYADDQLEERNCCCCCCWVGKNRPAVYTCLSSRVVAYQMTIKFLFPFPSSLPPPQTTDTINSSASWLPFFCGSTQQHECSRNNKRRRRWRPSLLLLLLLLS